MYAGVLRAEGVLVTQAASTDQIAFSQRQSDGTWAPRQITVANLLTDSSTGLAPTTVPYINSSGDLTSDVANFWYNVSSGELHATTFTAGKNATGGLSGFVAYPHTINSGFLVVESVATTGNFVTRVQLASQSGAYQYSIPNAGAACSFFMTSGNQTVAGANTFTGTTQINTLAVGSSAGGTQGIFRVYPITPSHGLVGISAVGNVGNFNTVISDVSSLGQSITVTVPDPGQSTANFVLDQGASTINGNRTFANGSVTIGGGTLNVGSSAQAGIIDIFGGGASTGYFSISNTNISSNIITLTPAGQSGSRTYTIPDAGASTNFVMAAGASTIAGVKTFSSIPLGTQYIAQVYLPTITALAGQVTVLHSCMFNGTVTFISAAVNAAFATSNIVITCSINGAGITGGVVTITQSGSAAGTTGTATPSNNNNFVTGNYISAAITGGTGTVNGVISMLMTRVS